MARIRTIKPEFFTSEDIVSLTPLTRLFYVSLWCEADREGRLEWKPGTFKLRYLPGDKCSVETLGVDLAARGLLFFYMVDGVKYAEIPTFTRHQVINNRESDSKIPINPDACARVKVACTRVEAEGKEGREGKGMERSWGAKRRTQIPADFYPNETGLNAATAKNLTVAVELTRFRDYHGGKGSVMLDWQAAWRTWVGNARGGVVVVNKQQALEDRNRAVGLKWAEKHATD